MHRLNILKNNISHHTLKAKTIVISGGSRGIGLAIALKCAKDGANIAILAKTTQPHPKLPGTIYTASEQIIKSGGKCLPLKCDIRSEQQVKKCIEAIIKQYGGIDILINNASAINLSNTEQLTMKQYDLMHNINLRGTFMLTKYCLPYLRKSNNPHVLNLSPPLNMNPKWFQSHVAYTMAKYGMSMCVLGMAQEFKPYGIGVNALWPRTAIATAAVQNILGGDESIKSSRLDTIMGDAAYYVLISNSRQNTGNFYIDEDILKINGITDLKPYQVDVCKSEKQLILDFFL